MRIRRNKTILEQAADYVEAAVEKAGPILADAKDKAGSALSDARDQAGPVLADARDKASPLIAQSAALAAEKASQVAELAADKASAGKELASTKAAELTGKPKKRHRVRTLLLLTGLAAALGFLAKKLTSGGGDKDGWQSSYTPTPPPRDADRTDAPLSEASNTASDEGGAGPDEALADADDESHNVTTPDEPAEVIDVAPGEEPVEKSAGKP